MENVNIVIDKLEDMHNDITNTKKALDLLITAYKRDIQSILNNQAAIMKLLQNK